MTIPLPAPGTGHLGLELPDVEFDHGAAAEAVAAATRALAALGEVAAAREAICRAALRDAEGAFAAHLADQLDQARSEAEGHRSWLEVLRRQIEHASDRAAVEQVRRRALRGELLGLAS